MTSFTESEVYVLPETVVVHAVVVNVLQYERILKRRLAKEKLIREGRLPATRQPYLHASRHAHCINRMRSKGRFSSFPDINMKRACPGPNGSEVVDIVPLNSIRWIPIVPAGHYPAYWNIEDESSIYFQEEDEEEDD